MRTLSTLVVLTVLTLGVAQAETKFTLTGENTTVQFVGTKPGDKHEGGFKKLTGTAVAPGTDPTGLKLAVEIATSSIYSDNFLLTMHLKGTDFFDVKKHPTAKFVSTKIAKVEEGYTITGDLTLCGKTKSITFPAKMTLKEDALTLESSFKINRMDFGMTYGKGKIDDEVTLTVRVKAGK
jgi:polyisoprenoid-binding protein YceI